MTINRRRFLEQLAVAGVVSIGSGRPPSCFARMADSVELKGNGRNRHRVLVLIQLAGGNDGLNTVVPYGDPQYRKARPAIAVANSAVLRIDDYLGLHPAMQGFREIYDTGRLAIVQGVGYPNPNRSHFRSMDIWHSAEPDREHTLYGWAGRTLEAADNQQLGNFPALAFGVEKLPLALLSSTINVPTVRDLSGYHLQFAADPEENHELQKRTLGKLVDCPADAGSNLEFLRKTTLTAFSSAEKLKHVASTYQPTTTYPDTALGQKLKVVAQVITSELGTRIIFVSLGGFDTHSRQQAAHQALLTELASAVRAFQLDLEGHRLLDQVLLVTFSEFGRRVQENGSLGTDHGAASQMFVMAPAGRGGIYGKHPSLTDLHHGDLKFHTDFRSVYATLLDKWLHIPSDRVLGRRFPTLDFV